MKYKKFFIIIHCKGRLGHTTIIDLSEDKITLPNAAYTNPRTYAYWENRYCSEPNEDLISALVRLNRTAKKEKLREIFSSKPVGCHFFMYFIYNQDHHTYLVISGDYSDGRPHAFVVFDSVGAYNNSMIFEVLEEYHCEHQITLYTNEKMPIDAKNFRVPQSSGTQDCAIFAINFAKRLFLRALREPNIFDYLRTRSRDHKPFYKYVCITSIDRTTIPFNTIYVQWYDISLIPEIIMYSHSATLRDLCLDQYPDIKPNERYKIEKYRTLSPQIGQPSSPNSGQPPFKPPVISRKREKYRGVIGPSRISPFNLDDSQ